MQPSDIKEHMEVCGADGKTVGKVDRVEGNRIKLTKDSAPAGHKDHHHFIDLSLVSGVDGGKVTLSKNADQVSLQEA
ncbi:DUF2171 domain-containing protein [Pseudorhodoplanes sp.]|uniref:DUF2171 domain-containing protein n=1 Tax=Pseudorhodoplanes sp. TaxID=1934341 RepID=UPI00391C8906